MIEYPAITIWQPWATLIAEECKPMEFRSWPISSSMIGTRVAIHAGARPVRKDEVRELLLHLHSSYWRETGLKREESIKLLEPILMAPRSMALSCIVCTAIIGKPIRDAELCERMGVHLINDSDRPEHTNYGWPLSEIQRLTPPEPARGRQGWWTWRSENPAISQGKS